MNKNWNSLLLFSIALMLSACSSQVYSPSLGLSPENLKNKQIDISGGVAMLPETQPHIAREATEGAFVKVGFGFSDSLSLHFNMWSAFKNDKLSSRRGYSFAARWTIKTNEKSHVELIPRTAVLLDGNTINGYGFAIVPVYITPVKEKLFFYIGGGPAIGTKEFRRVERNGINVYPYGFGFVGHFAFGYTIFPNLRAVLEVNPIYEFNQYDKERTYLITPSLTVGYLFK